MPSNSTTEQISLKENASHISAELQGLHDKLSNLESKVSAFETKCTDNPQPLGVKPPTEHELELMGLEEEDDYEFHRNFYYFLRKIHRSATNMNLLNRVRARDREAEDSVTTAPQDTPERQATAARIITQAFLQGDPARVFKGDWNVFLFRKPDLETAVMTPIEVVSTEPDSQTLMQLQRAMIEGGVTSSSTARDIGKEIENSTKRPLPERIKIQSASLLEIFSQITDSSDWKKESKPVVLLRPFQELLYYEQHLRKRLDDLEKRFVRCSQTENVQAPATICHNDGSTTERPMSSEHDVSSLSVSSATFVDTGIVETEAGESLEPKLGEGGKPHGKSLVGDESHKTENDKPTNTEDEPSNSVTALLHLRCLIDFVDKEIKPKQEYIGSSKCSHIHFHDLWYLFKPGDEIVEQDEKQVYVVLRVQGPRHKVEDPWGWWRNQRSLDDEDKAAKNESQFTLHCSYIDFDGKKFGPVSRQFSIPPFGDLKPVQSLPVYPLRLARGVGTRKTYIDRGRMLLEVASFKAMYYVGATLDKRDEIDSQVVIDFNEALADEDRRKAWEPVISNVNTAPEDRDDDPCMSACCIHHSVRDGVQIDAQMTEDYIRPLLPGMSLQRTSLILSPRSLEDTIASINELTETELILMTYRVFGFVLRSRKWAQLDLGFLRYENKTGRDTTIDAFNQLELPDGHREMVRSLVTQHFRSRQPAFARDEQTDLIQGKGKGLIMLLHGAPGVGKTTTAEGIAEIFRRPLFQITCGDLGTTAREVETELEKSFALASRWGCILLLDEADVFLSSRERKDFTRNGLVAVFLRVLEYYTGILFLTTNRIGDLDEAFASRIHMSLHYPELDEDKTAKVFKLHLQLIKRRFEKQSRIVNIDFSSIDKFAKDHFHSEKFNRWNGRQIRNACQTALALAEYDAQHVEGRHEITLEVNMKAVVDLHLKYFLLVQKAYIDFGNYVADVRGTQGDRRAIDLELRAKTKTPYDERSRFSSLRDSNQRSDSLYSSAHNRSSDLSHPAFDSPEGTFRQGYPHNTGTPRSGSYGLHSSPEMPHFNTRTGSFAGGYDNYSPVGQPRDSPTPQADAPHSWGRQQGQQFDPRQLIPARDFYPNSRVSFEDRLPPNIAQPPPAQYNYDPGRPGGSFQGENVPTQAATGDASHPQVAYR